MLTFKFETQLSLVVFLTLFHVWILAIAIHSDYVKAGLSMLPVVFGDQGTSVVVMCITLMLVGISILPYFYGMNWLYLAGAVSGGGYFIYQNYKMILEPTPKVAMKRFFASMVHLGFLLIGAVIEVLLLGLPIFCRPGPKYKICVFFVMSLSLISEPCEMILPVKSVFESILQSEIIIEFSTL